MMESGGDMGCIREKWLQDLVVQVGNQLNARKMMEILTLQLDKDANELAYVKDRLETSQRELERTEEAVKDVQRRMFESKDLLVGLEETRKSAEEEYARFLAARDVDGMREELANLKGRIAKCNEDIRFTSNKFLLMQSTRQEGIRQRERLEEKCANLEADLRRIDQEIEVSRTTISLIMGKKPESFDEDSFRSVQGDVQENIQKITRELVEETDKVRNQIVSMKKRTDEMEEEKKTLSSQKEALQETVDRLKLEIGEDKSREAVESLKNDVSKLKARKKQLADDMAGKEQEMDRIEKAMGNVVEQLEVEKATENNGSERYAYLKALMEEVRSLPSVTDEIERLEIETGRLKRDSKINQSLNDVVQELNNEVAPLTSKLKSSLKEVDLLFEDFKAEIQSESMA